MTHSIIDIHIQRNKIGKVFPFEKLYLMHKDDVELIPRIFQYAMVLPLRPDMLLKLKTLKPATVHLKHFARKDADLNKPVDMTANPDWWDAFIETYELKKRVAIIPVLVSTVRRIIRPRYLTSARWRKFKQNGANPTGKNALVAYDEFAYLATPQPAPQNKIAPLCMICPRMLLQLQGECTPGDEVCYTSLNFATLKESDASVSADHDLDYRLP